MKNYTHPFARRLEARARLEERRLRGIEDKLSPRAIVHQNNANGLREDAEYVGRLRKIPVIGIPLSYALGAYFYIN